MQDRTKTYLLFTLLMALAAGIYLWYYPLDRGTASISVGLTDYWVFNQTQSVQCSADPCIMKLKSGKYELKIRKDGYFPESAKVKIGRFQTETVAVQLKKVPTLAPSDVVPAETTQFENKPIPKSLDAKTVAAPTWDSKGEQMAYLDKADEKVKVWKSGASKVITPLAIGGTGLKFFWSSDNLQLTGVALNELYFIDTQKASRKKVVLEFEPKNLLWTPANDALMVNDAQNKVYKIDPKGGKPIEVPLGADLSHAVWSPDGKLVYYTVDAKENQTKVLAFDPATNESTEIVSKFDFPVSKITRDINGAIYLYNPTQTSWSVLEY